MDHCAVVPEPMDFQTFFDNTTFYEGRGNWVVFEAMQREAGSPPENRDSYLIQRRLARGSPHVKKINDAMIVMVKEVIK